MLDALQLPFVQRGLWEVLLLAVACGLIGTWIVLRGLSFYAHATGTAAFPGLVLADGLGFAPALGAFATAVVLAGGVAAIARERRTGFDSATALVLVACLAAGVVLASDVFHSGGQVESLLFGSLLLIDARDVALAGAAALVVLAATLTIGPRWLARGFDPETAAAVGLRGRWPDAALLVLIAFTSTAALSAVGALLATALLIVPAATVRLWTDRLVVWQLASVALAAVLGVAGVLLSYQTDAPPGATIATLAGAVFVVAALGRYARPRRIVAAAASVALLGAVAAGCGSDSGAASSSGGRLSVVATTTQLGDFARNVGGNRVDVHQLLKPNTDPHDYEPRPSDVTATANAKLVLESGVELDHWMGKVVDQAGGGATQVDIGNGVPIRRGNDPHWWHDPRNAHTAVERIRDAFAKADPGHTADYDANAERYLARVDALDAGIQRCFAAVPAAERKLVTDHDAFEYFTSRYGIKVIGAVIPSTTTQAQPSAGDTARLARLVKREHVKAIFPEASLNPDLAHALARATGASSNYTLYGDTLGPKGSRGATYLSMEVANADAMVRGFTDGKSGCGVRP